MAHAPIDPLDELRHAEEHPDFHTPGGDSAPLHDLGQPKYGNAAPDSRYGGGGYFSVGDSDDDDSRGPNLRERAKDEVKGRLEDEANERLHKGGRRLASNARDRFSSGARKGAEELGQGARHGLQQAGKQTAEQGVRAAGTAGTEALAGGATTATTAGVAGAAAGGAALEGGAATVAGVGIAGAPETAGVSLAVSAGAATVAAAPFVAKHKYQIATGIALAGLTALLGSLFIIGLFKGQVFTKSARDKALAPLSALTSSRSYGILGQYVFSGSDAAKSDGHDITTGKSGELFDAMRKKGFEQRVKDQYNMTFTRGPRAGTISINKDGQSIGVAANASQATQILRDHPAYTSQVINDEVHAWNWTEHFKVARPAKTTYNVPQLHIPDGKANTTDGITNAVKYRLTTLIAPWMAGMGQTITCFTSTENCKPDGGKASGDAPATKVLQDNETSSIQKAAQTALDANMNDIKAENGYDVPRLDERVSSDMNKSLNTATLPMLGWLDFSTAAETVQDNPDYAQLPVKQRTNLAGSVALFQWSTQDQGGADDLSPEVTNVFNRNFHEIEGSQGYNYVAYDDAGQGKGLSADEKINSNSANPMKLFYEGWKTAHPSLLDSLPILGAWKTIRSTALNLFINIATNTPIYTIFSLAVTKIPIVKDLFAKFINSPIISVIATSFGMSSKLTLPVYDPSDQTQDYGNYLVTGYQVIAQDTCKKAGCADNLTAAEMRDIRAINDKEQASYMATLPWTDRLFNRDVPNSFINMAILRSPLPYKSSENMAAAFNGFFSIIKSLPSNLGRIYSQPARAAGDDGGSTIAGIATNFGFTTQALLDNNVASELSANGSTCPTTSGQNMCVGDNWVMDGWLARYLGYDAAVAKGL